jgi:hypothetical protein
MRRRPQRADPNWVNRRLICKLVLSVVTLAAVGVPAVAVAANSRPLPVEHGQATLVSAVKDGQFTVSDTGSRAGKVFVSGTSHQAQLRVVLRDAATRQALYVGTLAGLANIPIGRIGPGQTRRFAIEPERPAAVTLTWTAVSV